MDLHRGLSGLGISLAGNRDRAKMSVFICGMHPKGSAFKDGRLKIGDEILEVNFLLFKSIFKSKHIVHCSITCTGKRYCSTR